jgi:L-amino acid N-acyltransferase YncA
MTLVTSGSRRSQQLFTPHEMTAKVFRRLLNASYYLAIGYRRSGQLAGYAFIHLYFPRRAFAGYFVTDAFQGMGIGKHLFGILRQIAGANKIPLYTYVHEDNQASVRISPDYVIEQRVPGGFLVLRHLEPDERAAQSPCSHL